jgi:hypothetical protein
MDCKTKNCSNPPKVLKCGKVCLRCAECLEKANQGRKGKCAICKIPSTSYHCVGCVQAKKNLSIVLNFDGRCSCGNLCDERKSGKLYKTCAECRRKENEYRMSFERLGICTTCRNNKVELRNSGKPYKNCRQCIDSIASRKRKREDN